MFLYRFVNLFCHFLSLRKRRGWQEAWHWSPIYCWLCYIFTKSALEAHKHCMLHVTISHTRGTHCYFIWQWTQKGGIGCLGNKTPWSFCGTFLNRTKLLLPLSSSHTGRQYDGVRLDAGTPALKTGRRTFRDVTSSFMSPLLYQRGITLSK